MKEFKFKIGISFSGSFRPTVKKIVDELINRGYSEEEIFFDEYRQAEANGDDKDDFFYKTFKSECAFIVVLLSSNYAQTIFTRAEWKGIREFITDHKDKICYLQIEDFDRDCIPCFTASSITTDIRAYSTSDIADFIVRKYSLAYPNKYSKNKSVKTIVFSSPKKKIKCPIKASSIEEEQCYYLDPIYKKIRDDDTKFQEAVSVVDKFLYSENSSISVKNIIEYLENEDNDALVSMSIRGKYGTGKSTLFTLLYHYFIKKYKKDSGGCKKIYPILIDLNKLTLLSRAKAQDKLRTFFR